MGLNRAAKDDGRDEGVVMRRAPDASRGGWHRGMWPRGTAACGGAAAPGVALLGEAGQTALMVVLGVVVILGALSTALFAQVSAESPVVSQSVNVKVALVAAQAGITDYQDHLAANPSYGSSYCSNTGTWNCWGKQPDKLNPAFVSTFTPSCQTSAAGALGWETMSASPSGGVTSSYQYVVDSSVLGGSPTNSGMVYVYATGRAGTSGHYVCQSVQASFFVQRPTLADQVSTSEASPAWTNIRSTGSTSEEARISMAGGSGGPGGNGGACVGCTTAPGGQGTEIQATFVVPVGDGLSDVIGQQGRLGSGGGGSGFGNGGAGGNDSGGGGGATAVCLYNVSAGSSGCGSASVCTGSSPATPCVLAIAGGGGGGGEMVCWGSLPGGGGNGGMLTPGSSGGPGLTGFLNWDTGPATGGTSTGPGQGGTGYSELWFGSTPNGNPGQGSDGGAGVTFGGNGVFGWWGGSDSGGGGGGYFGGGSGAAGGNCGGGGGGGGGSSYVDQSLILSGPSAVAAPPGPGFVITQVTSGKNVELDSVWSPLPGGSQPNGNGWTTAQAPSGAFQANITIWGAGGGGGGGGPANSSNGQQKGGPGGPGSEVSFHVPVTSGQDLAVSVGGGGAGGGWVNGGCGAPNVGGAGGPSTYGSGGTGGGVGSPCGFLSVTNSNGGGGGGGGGATAICFGSGGCTQLLAIAGGGGGGGGGGCYPDNPNGGAGASTNGSNAQSYGQGGQGGNGSGGGGGGGIGSGGGGGSGPGATGGNGGNGPPGSGGNGGQGANAYDSQQQPGGGGGGGGYSGGGGGSGNWCITGTGVGGSGGGGSSWISPAASSPGITFPTPGYPSGASNSCSSTTLGYGGEAAYNDSPNGNTGLNGCNGAISLTWVATTIAPNTGSCTPTTSSFSVPATGSWTVSVAGGGGYSGLVNPPSQSGTGGAGALVAATVPFTAGEKLGAVVGCSAFSIDGGLGFTNGGGSGNTTFPGVGGGGGGSSALCLMGSGATISSCSALSSSLGSSSSYCTSAQPPSSGACLLVVAGGGGGGGSGADGPSCTGPAGWLGGQGGDLLSKGSPVFGGTVLPGRSDGAGKFGAGTSMAGSPAGDGWYNGNVGFGGGGPSDGSGGGGGGLAGGQADPWGASGSWSECGGGGGSSWVTGVAKHVIALANTCTVGGKPSTDCPGTVTATDLPASTTTFIASRPETLGSTTW